MRIHTAAELREIDLHAAGQLLVPTSLLMENAGRAVAEIAREEAARRGGKVMVVCGKGNNGGDGFVAARHLKSAGIVVRLVSLATPEEMSGDAASAARAALACGVPTDGSIELAGRGDVIIDALFGTGLTRAPEGRARDLILAMTEAGRRGAFVIAVDLPSGLRTELPQPPGDAVIAHCTVALHALKPALVQYPARGFAGDIRVASLGIPSDFAPGPVRRWITQDSIQLPQRRKDSHKGTSGHVLVVAGSDGKSGAAHLACIAALRSGAGLVTLASSRDVIDRVLSSVPEAMGWPMDRVTTPALLDALEGKDALAIGPGIERTGTVANALLETLRHTHVHAVIDADALNALAEDHVTLGHLGGVLERPVLTPHPAELARLLQSTTAEVQRDRFASATEAAKRFHAHVVLKGACSVIAHPDGSLEVNSTGNEAMATAGMGDALTGVVGALLAQRVSSADAAMIGTFVHGRAGDLARVASRGLLATDVAAKLPQAFAELG